MNKIRAFLIADKILYRPALAWLQSSYALASDLFGVTVFERDDARVIVADPEAVSFPALASELRNTMRAARELNTVAPSVIQYFASKMDVGDPIFEAIDRLSRFVVAVQDAPTFRILHDAKAQGADRYKHRVTFSSFPRSLRSVRCHYLAADGRPMLEKDLDLKRGVRHVAVPLVFYHSALGEQRFDFEHLIRSVDDQFDYERAAYDELMLRFPSRDPDVEGMELQSLAERLPLTPTEIGEVWRHNRAQWDEVRTKLAVIGCNMPAPVKRGEPGAAYHQYTHLVMSGVQKLLVRLDAPPARIRYLGLPMFARNGVTIPLGTDGILREAKDFSGETLNDRITNLLPSALAARFNVDVSTKPRQTVVAAP